MARITDEKLEQLRVKKERLEAKLKQLKQQQRYQDRKDETRRKIITGASVGAAVRDGVVSPKLLAHVLDKYVTKDNEREFMGLGPKRGEVSRELEQGEAASDVEPLSEQELFEQGEVKALLEEDGRGE